MSDANLDIEIRAKNLADKELRELEKKLKDINDKTKLVGGAALAMGAAIVGATALSVKKYAELGSEVHDLALATGISTESVSEWSYALKQSGGDASLLQVAIKQMSSAIIDASDGLETQRRAFRAINVDYKDLREMSPEKQFETIAYAISALKDSTLKASVAQDLFGRSAMNLLPLIAEGESGMSALRQEARDLGIVFDKETADKADKLGDSLTALTSAADGLKLEVANALAPTITELANSVTDALKSFREWSEANPELANSLTRITVEAGLVLVPFGALIMAMPRLTALAKALTTANWLLKASFVGLPFVIPAVWMALDELDKHFDLPNAKEFSRTADNQILAFGKLGDSIEAADARMRGFGETQDIYSERDIKAYEALGFVIKRVNESTQSIEANEQALKESADAIKSTYDLFKTASERYRDNLDSELDKARDVTREKIDLLRAEYDEKIRTLNAETDAAVASVQAQIDAIDALTEQEDKALDEQERKRRQAELEQAVDDAETYESRRRAEQELRDYVEQITRERLLDQRNAEKDALRDKIEDLRTAANDERLQLEQELVKKQEHENALLKQTEDRLAKQTSVLDAALDQELARIDAETYAYEQAEKEKLEATLKRIGEVIKALNTIPREINVDVNVTQNSGTGASGSTRGRTPVTTMAQGGIIDEPIYGLGLSSGRKYLMGESGREYVTPQGRETHVHLEIDGREIARVVLDKAGKLLRQQGVY